MHKCSLHDENLYRLVSKLRNHSEYAFYQYTMIGTIATDIRQGWEHKCEVVGQGSFVLPNACCLSTVICVLQHCHLRMWQATATVTRTSLAAASHLCLHMCWLLVYLRCGVDQVICWTLSWDVCLLANSSAEQVSCSISGHFTSAVAKVTSSARSLPERVPSVWSAAGPVPLVAVLLE